VDASALAKLLLREPETDALRHVLDGAHLVSSALTATELRRAVRRHGPSVAGRVDGLLATVTLLAVDRPVLDRAVALGPVTLRSLDALHLATALDLGPRLDVLLTYDLRLAEAAGAAGLTVAGPA